MCTRTRGRRHGVDVASHTGGIARWEGTRRALDETQRAAAVGHRMLTFDDTARYPS
jgi:hypothetical protein